MTPDPPEICRVLDRVIDVAAWPLLVLICAGIIWAAVALVKEVRRR